MSNDIKKDGKWEFEDYAFTINGIIVAVLLPLPEIIYNFFGIHIFGVGMSEASGIFSEGLEYGFGFNLQTLTQLRALSPMLFLLTITIVLFHDAIVARKTGGYTGSLFTHTFESLFEDAIYMAITTIMVYGAILFGAIYASWLGGPVSWILFVFIFPLVRKRDADTDNEVDMPWLLLGIFIFGVIAEVIIGTWIIFPLSWLTICSIKLFTIIRDRNYSANTIFDMIYHAFMVVLIAVGIVLDFWMVSWAAFPIALFICWILGKFDRFKKVKSNE